ncbi:glycoside hydrolase domain-containing protein [Sedimentisphaera cyanobacteriorum]|uniref:glycoside hydrolase domain-containing protein n=1 Tax=Sedimentisphaera cyanobacteriorum TaxID=1940790 RepID=UPI000F5049C7|nr:glycoside hydrolase domain-containing protein [Sedimentisphaera cyanobacteriorum]
MLILIFFAVSLQARVIDYVDVFVGTEADHGQMYPGAALPFGLVKLSPDTSSKGHAGYDYSCREIKGFSHTRLGGVGCSGAGGSVRIKPSFGMKTADTLDKSSEKAWPGFYSACFENGIKTELTVSYRVGFHRYTFPVSKEDVCILIDLSQSYAGSIDSGWEKIASDTIAGFTKGKNVCGNGFYKLYFAVKFDQCFDGIERSGKSLWSRFPSASKDRDAVIKLKVGISPVSVEKAVMECRKDLPGWDFQAPRENAEKIWEEKLGKVEIFGVSGELEEFRDLFYTCLYRSYLLPHNVTSSDGFYRPAGKQQTIRKTANQSRSFDYYSGWSSWDDYRKYSLVSLLEPDILSDIVLSALDMFAGEGIPAWAEGYWPSPSVRNEFINTIILDTIQKGLVEYDLEKAYSGIISSIDGNEQVEKPYQYYIAMKIAEILEKKQDIQKFRKKALSYKDFWAESQEDGEGNVRGFFTPDGEIVPKESVNKVDAHFYEGSLWHYRFFVPHDIYGLASLRGVGEKLADDLEYYFNSWKHMALNEPPLAYPFLFNFLGRPYQTQYWSRVYITDTVMSRYHNHGKFDSPVIRRVYKKQPAGWLETMDDDTGAMSSHFVFSAMGLFPVCMGEPYYVIGSPLFPKMVLHMKNGDLVIEAENASLSNKYIQSVSWNGKDLANTWLSYEQIKQGGKLDMVMSDTPNMQWGSDNSAAPPSLSK